MLADCPPAFALPARQCLELAQHIYQEFAETAARHELDAFMTNIAHLAYAHRTLHRRAQRFGRLSKKPPWRPCSKNTLHPPKTL